MHLAIQRRLERNKMPIQFQVLLIKRLARLLAHGYSLQNALTLMSYDPHQGKMAFTIKHFLKDGTSLSEAFKALNFSSYIVSFIYFSNASGQLDQRLKQCAFILEQQEVNRKKIQKVIRYPLILFSILIFLLIFIKIALIPNFSQLYHSMQTGVNETRPAVLMWSITVLNNTVSIISITVFIILAGSLSWMILRYRLDIKKKVNLYKFIPIYRNFKSLSTTVSFSLHFSSLLDAGLTIKQSLQIIKSQPYLPILSFYSQSIIQALEKGVMLPEALNDLPLIKKEVASIVRRGIDEGDIEQDLKLYADLLIESFHERINQLISLVQPLFLIIFGVLIVILYLSILLPVMQWIQYI